MVNFAPPKIGQLAAKAASIHLTVTLQRKKQTYNSINQFIKTEFL